MSLNNFQLSLIEAEEINKIMPHPYRLESESNIPIESINYMNKLNAKSKSNSKVNTTVQKKKPKNENNEKSKSIQIINTGKSTGLTNIGESEKKICENFYAYIENCEYCNIFFTQKYLDEPCLIDIQNKLKGRKYHRLLDIVMDLRNLCLYYADRKFNNKINYNAIQLLKFVETTYKSFYSGMDQEYKEALKTALKMDNKNNKMFDEKDLEVMAEQIKKLNPKHLIGLVKLIKSQLNDKNDDKYYEFDLNDLDMNTLNKINIYIKNITKEK
jgi:hypothetical protein